MGASVPILARSAREASLDLRPYSPRPDASLMDLSAGTLLAGMVVSTIGLGLFLYGKREARFPQLTAGMALMAFPMFVQGAAMISGVGSLILVGMWLALRNGL